MTAASSPRPRRALILAGGGLKVAFQAGVLQVWMDEAGIEFDHADGASGGVFNLAMYCNGRSGREIADAWRRMSPLASIQPNLGQLWKLWRAESLLRYDRFREKVLRRDWALDWEAIRRSERIGTFNTYNFSRHELEVVPNARMSEDLLVSAVSLPGWFPPVRVGGDRFVDAVYVTDANLSEAIRRGADELWIVWTVDDAGTWRNGPVNRFFQIIEASANGAFFRMLRRIARSNLDLAEGRPGEFGRPIDVRLLKARVPLHYLLVFRRRSLARAVDLGVRAARAWCEERGIALASAPAPTARPRTSLGFSEVMWGHVTPGGRDFLEAHRQGREAGRVLRVELTIRTDDVDAFIADPTHEASVTGRVVDPLTGGDGTLLPGSLFHLFVDHEGDRERKRMLYRLFFRGGDGREYTLSGFKVIEDDAGPDLWSDTTTLYTRVFEGRVGPEDEEGARTVATGILRVHLLDFLRQLTTFRAQGPDAGAEARALARFGRLFLGALWDVYGLEPLAPAPF
jgi:predicted acylesterase/phospholipase RssA